MKTTPNSLALSFVIRTVCLLAATSACQAQGDPDTANLVEVSPVPAQGTFFSMGRDFPPLPFDPFPDLPLFTVDAASGVYYYDDRGVNDSFAQGRAGVQIADDVPMPPGGSGGSGGGADWRFYALYPDGNVKWYLPMPGHTQPDSSPAISGDGSIVCGSCSPYVYDVNPDGSLNWSCHIPNTNDQMELIYSPPVIDICDSY
jgi:hypothetical protein